MNRNVLIFAVLASIALSNTSRAQYGDYEWATGLWKEFGFYDQAERIFTAMSGSGRSQEDIQLGKLGLAELKSGQAAKAPGVDAQLALYEEARKIMQEVVNGFTDKSSAAYQKAVFALVDLLQARGELAMSAVDRGTIKDEAKLDELRKAANADYGRAENELEKIRTALADAAPDGNREKWRFKNRAWYTICLLRYNKALTAKSNSANRSIILRSAEEELEKFIIENESEDEEALLGALHGNILMGQIKQELDEKTDALGYYSAVCNQILWDVKPIPIVQDLYEKATYHAINLYTVTKDYPKAISTGKEIEENYKKHSLEYRLLGRAVRVKVAEAHLRQGDSHAALEIVATLVERGGEDASIALANRLMAEIIAAAPDKTQFAPEVIRSAAKGAYSSPAKRADAVRYFQIVLQLLDKVKDEGDRAIFGAEAWYRIGYYYYEQERFLDSGLAFGEGARKYYAVTTDDLGAGLVKYWDRMLKEAHKQSGSPEIKKLLDECSEWQLRSGQGTKSPGELLFDKAAEKERLAQTADNEKKFADAVKLYQEANELYTQAIEKGGPITERAMMKGARTGLKVGKLYLAQKDSAKAVALIAQAKAKFVEYLRFADDPEKKLTDSAKLAARENAKAEARYSIAESNGNLADAESNPEKKKALALESLATLANFEKDHANQKSLVLFALAERVDLKLQVGDLAGAEVDLGLMKTLDSSHAKTTRAAFGVGQATKNAVEPELDALLGENFKATDALAVSKLETNPKWVPTRDKWLHACDLYREWLVSANSSRFGDWDTVTAMYSRIGAWEQSGELLQKALEVLNTSKTKPEDLQKLNFRALVAWEQMARKADVSGKTDLASKLWNDAGRALEVVLKDPKAARGASTQRLAAVVYGGYVTRKEGLYVFFPALAQPSKGIPIWVSLMKAAEAAGDTDGYWEARFYTMFGTLQNAKANKQDPKDVREVMKTLKATKPELGGERWKPYFEWMDRQL